MGSILETHNLAYRYVIRESFFRRRQIVALDQIDISLKEGQCMALLGGNGSGKSTLLRILCGIIKPTSGHLDVKPGYRRTLLSLGLGFRPELSGYDNALLALLYQGMTLSAARFAIPAIEEFADLGESFYMPIRTYSSGMRSRLGFATALRSSADIMCIDETLSVGDVEFRRKAFAALKDTILAKRAVVIVSHNIGQLTEICDSAVWLDRGRIRQCCPSR